MGSGNRITAAKRLILRYIESEGLSRGDRLPSHDFFRRLFGFGMTTISSAFESLRLDGVLEVRNKVGVFLLNPHPDNYFAYVVGVLVSNWIHGTPFYTQLLNAVHLSLVRLGCHVRFFFARPPKQHTPHLPLHEVSGLKTSLRQRELDALIHLDHLSEEDYAFLQQFDLPLLYIGIEGESTRGSNEYFLFDNRKMVHEICVRLFQCGVVRPLLQLAPGLSYLGEQFVSETSGRGLWQVTNSLQANDSLVSDYLSRPAGRRWDCLVSLDDLAALRILCGLSLHLPVSRLPRAFIVENRQLSLSYPVAQPMLYEIDLEDIACRATGYLFSQLKRDCVRFGSRYHPLPYVGGLN